MAFFPHPLSIARSPLDSYTRQPERPITSRCSLIKLISATTTKKGLKVVARLDKRKYEGGVEFSDEDMAKLNVKTHTLHPKWNYSIVPRNDTGPDGD
ncbi:unnamed protein product [marine sediment metagenome]|uniref:Rhodopirellula transposase n=1 Tax=marine sediment metagenome TaxID=412755 RepID=X1S1V0_9ZZZZ